MRILILLLTAVVFAFATLTDQTNNAVSETIINELDLDLSSKEIVEEIIANDKLFNRSDLAKAIVDSTTIANVEEILRKNDIPDIFLYIPVIESGYNNSVRYKGAYGIWQLVPVCAKFSGLKVSKKVDERRNWLKATNAVIKYFDYLHAKFGKWYLVVLAYNCGEGTLQKAISSVGSDKLEDLLSSKSSLPSITKGYVKRLMWIYNAAQAQKFQDILISKRERVGKTPVEKSLEVSISSRHSLKSIAKALGVSERVLSSLNSEWKKETKKEKVVTIVIPSDKKELFEKEFGEDK